MLTDAKVANNVMSESVRFLVVVFNWNKQEFDFFQPHVLWFMFKFRFIS